jgi:NTP pyrophosphatase (non-canonical NTP hydrolase)
LTVLEYTDRASSFDPQGPQETLTVVLCGSFRRAPERLRHCFDTLGCLFQVLSPRSIDFVDPDAEFVRLSDEASQPEHIIEELHLSALKSADFVWLFAPDGYVGTSAAMELGQAWALGVPVFASEIPSDPVIAAKVNVVAEPSSVGSVLLTQRGLPGLGLQRLQNYYRTTALRRGWSNESAKDTMLLLTEELGELARAVRKLEGISRHQSDGGSDVASELADMQLYLVHLANGLGLDLAVAVTDKERVNARRFERARVA